MDGGLRVHLYSAILSVLIRIFLRQDHEKQRSDDAEKHENGANRKSGRVLRR